MKPRKTAAIFVFVAAILQSFPGKK